MVASLGCADTGVTLHQPTFSFGGKTPQATFFARGKCYCSSGGLAANDCSITDPEDRLKTNLKMNIANLISNEVANLLFFLSGLPAQIAGRVTGSRLIRVQYRYFHRHDLMTREDSQSVSLDLTIDSMES